MTPAARLSATIELLHDIFTSWQSEIRIPADKLLDGYFRKRRYIGSKDRGAVSELVYWILRHYASLSWWCARLQMPAEGRNFVIASLLFRGDAEVAELTQLFDGSKYAPLPLTDREWQFAHKLAQQSLQHEEMGLPTAYNFPQWMEPYLQRSFGKDLPKQIAALAEQAPVDLRTNTLLATRDQLQQALAEQDIETSLAPSSPVGLRLEKRAPVFATLAFRQGLFEMQDEGSQIVGYLVDAKPGQKIIDFCAGAGGKTLCIAAQMENKGRILAWDTSAKRLSQLPNRLRRAGVHNTEWKVIKSESDSFIKRHKLSADRVLIDVPCSGSGTWRRNPDIKWRFTESDLQEIMAIQERILDSASRLVKPGGRLIYATCSVLKEENEKQIEAFLSRNSNFTVVCAQKIWDKKPTTGSDKKPSFLSLTPHQDGTDGFFAAVLERVNA